ncbi:hypothetical protein CMUS01_01652 [Colletotrichum musicola]|uniref:Uncharacterized protein n=1 Tax=Colletotrichum musicola TaxID=2175873 RepID=A0A8H6NWH3_9PEZI|nr:hypothetical protein CMUS01_01652 [Colletotrichum musicola]
MAACGHAWIDPQHVVYTMAGEVWLVTTMPLHLGPLLLSRTAGICKRCGGKTDRLGRDMRLLIQDTTDTTRLSESRLVACAVLRCAALRCAAHWAKGHMGIPGVRIAVAVAIPGRAAPPFLASQWTQRARVPSGLARSSRNSPTLSVALDSIVRIASRQAAHLFSGCVKGRANPAAGDGKRQAQPRRAILAGRLTDAGLDARPIPCSAPFLCRKTLAAWAAKDQGRGALRLPRQREEKDEIKTNEDARPESEGNMGTPAGVQGACQGETGPSPASTNRLPLFCTTPTVVVSAVHRGSGKF